MQINDLDYIAQIAKHLDLSIVRRVMESFSGEYLVRLARFMVRTADDLLGRIQARLSKDRLAAFETALRRARSETSR